jgi:Group II intron, maturase-specific domain
MTVRPRSSNAAHRILPGIREITARSQLRVPVEVIVRDLNRFLRGWAGYFRYGNSARFFDKITLHALRRLAWFIAKRHKRRKRYGWWVVVHQTHRTGLIDLNGTIVAPRPTSRHPGS